MRILFSSLLIASLTRAARAASVSLDEYRDHYDPAPAAAVEFEDATGVGGGSGEEERNLSGSKGDKGGKGGKAHKASKHVGLEDGFVDLSEDFERDETALAQPLIGRLPVRDNSFLRAALVLENGKIVGKYVRADVNVDDPRAVHSTTKGLISLAIGKLIAEGRLHGVPLRLDMSLEEIFPLNFLDLLDPTTDFRKRVTIRELLTMTSGLHSGASIPPGDNLNEALYNPIFHPQSTNKGYNYMFRNNILSYVIYAITCSKDLWHCKRPIQYFAGSILPSLGVTGIGSCPAGSWNVAHENWSDYGNTDACSDGEFAWFTNEEGFEGATSGMTMTVNVMAKLGQLYLQGGKSAPGPGGEQVVPESWIDQTWTPHVKPPTIVGDNAGGFFWYQLDKDTWFSYGLGGQIIAVNRRLNRVVAMQSDLVGEEEPSQPSIAVIRDIMELTFQLSPYSFDN
mmetsp:Transcript_6746/g.15363  ORF Transcript_6746/g.15363 Transcript_6746/m.15363 type:complete len:453 (-) Transcript_6746:213-1571(-)